MDKYNKHRFFTAFVLDTSITLFDSLLANSAELDGNNESTAVRNISNERLNVVNDNTSANSTER